MALIGSRRSRGDDEYFFVDGKAMRADEVVRIEVDAPGYEDTAVLGSDETRTGIAGGRKSDQAAVPGQDAAEMRDITSGSRSRRSEGKQRGDGKKWSAKRAFDELDSGSAFDLNEETFDAQSSVSLFYESEKRSTRKMTLILLAILIVVICVSMCISYTYTATFYSPVDVARTLVRRVYLLVGQLFGLDYYTALSSNEAANEINGYSDILARGNITFVTLVCGLLLSVSGMLYQNVFRNPIASPTMIGVSSGVRIGTIALVVTFGTAALNYENLRYVYCYIGGITILLCVLLFSKLLAGRGRKINVADMLIVGSIVSQLLSTVSQYFLTEILSDEEWEVFYELTSGMRNTTTGWAGLLFLTIVLLVCFVPLFLDGFRINMVAFDDSEARLMGVNPTTMRVFVLCIGTVAILAAQIHVGVISMVSLVVPFLVRYLVGSEFRKQLIGNMLLGPILLIICRDICSMASFSGTSLSISVVVGVVALPLYIWMMALGQKGWE